MPKALQLTPLELWQRFSTAFVDAVRAAPDGAIRDGWSTLGSRTGWYTRTIMPAVARALGLDLELEFLVVDFMMSEEAVPAVFVESENDAFSAAHEVRKLCSVAAPLKVLVTCVEWSATPGDWPNGGAKADLLGEWLAILRRHHERWPQTHMVGICVAEMRGRRFRIDTLGLGPDGTVVDAELVALERVIAC